MKPPRLKIGIAGAGPAGLAAALLLSRAGHRVSLFERFETPHPVGSGLILQPTGLAVLHQLALLPTMLSLGSRIDRLHGAEARTGRTVLDVRYAAGGTGRFGLAVHRAALHGTLLDAVRDEGLAIEGGITITGREGDGPSYLLAEGGRRIGPFDLLVDAGGSRSPLRAELDGGHAPRSLAYGAFWASLPWREGAFDPHALTQRYQRAAVMIGVLPIGRAEPDGEKLAAFFWSLKPAEVEAVRGQGVEAWRTRVTRIWPEAAAYADQVTSFEQLTLARYAHHTLVSPAARGLAVIGDSAHATSPQLGQGANMALLDAAALVHALKTGADLADGLARYSTARRWHVRLFQLLSLAFTPFYQSDSRVLPWVRDRVVAHLAKMPPTPKLLQAVVSGTLLDPFSPVGLTEPDWNHVRAMPRQPEI